MKEEKEDRALTNLLTSKSLSHTHKSPRKTLMILKVALTRVMGGRMEEDQKSRSHFDKNIVQSLCH